MTNLLEHPKFGQIRVEKQGAEFLFCAKDVCNALGLVKTESALRTLDDDEKLMLKIRASGQKLDDDERLILEISASGQRRGMLFVTESGMYALIIRSNKPEARKFRRWITSEVLPSLRKYGVYSMDRKVMDRAAIKAERAAVKCLLAEVRNGLSDTDIRMVAQKCRADEWFVRRVLDGYKEDPYMLAILYARSTGNRLLRKDFYTHAGAERLLTELRSKG